MRDEKAVLRVIDLCTRCEEKAQEIYRLLLRDEREMDLRELWASLASEEDEHRSYWLRLKDLCAAGAVPEVFDDPRRYVDELRTLLQRLENLAVVVRAGSRPPESFVHALRLEFILLHPAFVTLFHYLPAEPDLPSPSRTYDLHLGRLMNAIMDFDRMTPELELLVETIGQVWRRGEEVASRAVVDGLTGCLNRRGLYIAMKPLACLAKRERQTVGVMIMEVTNLRGINREFGHKVGDQILAATAQAITARLRASDAIGRFGGDDFLALLTRFDPARFEEVGWEVVARVGQVGHGNARPALAAAGAFTVMGEDVDGQLETLVRRADALLDTVRPEGRGCRIIELP